MQPQITALLSLAEGTSIVTESVWANRFKYTDQLTFMGADISVEGRTAVVQGVSKLVGAPVSATDLRAGAALIIAGLAAEGTTEIESIEYIDRGYEDVVEKITALGGNIKRVNIPEPIMFKEAL
jgi:UDP-N-acetylglucosamine 1-carboxyvinyltransferase